MLKKTIDNPRYPHRVRITRMVVGESNNPFKVGEEKEVVVYDGIGRGYTDTTTTGDKNVDSNKRKAVIPVRFDKWGEGAESEELRVKSEVSSETYYSSLKTTQLVPMAGDKLEVWKGMWYEEQVVRDAEPDNQRTIVYCEFVRN